VPQSAGDQSSANSHYNAALGIFKTNTADRQRAIKGTTQAVNVQRAIAQR
jgi:hypothetical protein